ncbi:MAG TPA: MFS transporter [Acidimicrobiia bacterium]|nr:MFS transporter [Acidimicrobiia bacterium]
MPHRSLRATVAVFFVVKLTLNVATRFVYAFLPAIARGLGVSIGAVGWLASARWGVGALTPLTIRLAGREHRRRVLALGLVLFVAGSLVTAVFGVFVGALVGFVLMGLGKPLVDTGVQAVVADRIPYRERARTVGVVETTWALGFLVGAPIAGWMIQRWGWEAPFIGFAVVGGLLLIPLKMVVGDSLGPAERIEKVEPNRRARAFLVVAALVAACAEVMFITFATWLEDVHEFGLGALAALATVIGFGELAAEGATALFTDRIGKARAVAAGMAVAAAGFTVTALTSAALAPALSGLVLGIVGFEFAIVSSISLATELVPGSRVQYLSRMVVSQAFGRAAAAVVGVALYTATGMTGAGLAAALIAVAAGWIVATRVRDHEDAPIGAGGSA